MNRSLTLRLFVIIMVMAATVILVSRTYAQYKSKQEMLQQLHSDMHATLVQCESFANDTQAYLQCHRRSFKNNLYNRFAGEATLCKDSVPIGPGGHAEDCALLAQNPSFWSSTNLSKDPRVQLVSNTLEGQGMWIAARHSAQSDIQIMVSEKSFMDFMYMLWNVRDNQLPVFVPILALLVFIMAQVLVKATLDPFNALKTSLNSLKPENLGNIGSVHTQYTEFEEFAAVYDRLCRRLNKSFIRARRFSSDAAHELRTPFSILRGHAERLIADAPEGSALQQRIRKMADEIERLIDMSEKLLLLSRADAQSLGHDRAVFNLSQFCNRLAQESETYHPSLSVSQSIEAMLVWSCDHSLISQMIHNLYTNAVKYNMPKGWIHFSLRRDGDFLELSIENPTPSIPEDLSQKAFDRFYRGDAARNRRIDGMGLGLSICEEIAILHQGTVSLKVTEAQTVVAVFRAPLSPLNA